MSLRFGVLLAVMVAVLLPSALACAAEPPAHASRLREVHSWACYYGADRRVLDTAVDLLVLDADALGALKTADKHGRRCLAYVSLGEAETHRWYWPEVQAQPWVLAENPHWPGARLVDVRAPAWRALVIERIARRVLSLGYDGLMLDTLDTVEALTSDNPLRYEGVASAMVALVAGLRAAHPQALLLANGGAGIVTGTTPFLDGALIESVGATWDFAAQSYRDRTVVERTADHRLERLRATGLPLFGLDYLPSDAPAARRAEVMNALRNAGLVPCTATIALHDLPVSP